MSEAPPKPAYVLYGRDSYLRARRRGQILQRFGGEHERQLTVTEFEASSELSEVLDALRTAPFLAPRRLVIVRDADPFVTRHRGALEKYLDSPSPCGSLLLTVDTWDAKWRLAKRVSQIGEATDCTGLRPREVGRWIAEAGAARGKRVDRAAAQALAEAIGGDAGRLDSEIEKLSIYVGSREEISRDDVEAVVLARPPSAWGALTRGIDARDAGRALVELDKMMVRRGDEFAVLGLIAAHLRQRRRGRASAGALRSVLRTDLAMKTGADAVGAMQALVASLCLWGAP